VSVTADSNRVPFSPDVFAIPGRERLVEAAAATEHRAVNPKVSARLRRGIFE
jgi:hypothetical protein